MPLPQEEFSCFFSQNIYNFSVYVEIYDLFIINFCVQCERFSFSHVDFQFGGAPFAEKTFPALLNYLAALKHPELSSAFIRAD